MKNNFISILWVLGGCFAINVSVSAATSATRRGPDVFHYSLVNRIGPTGIGNPATGIFQVQFNGRGDRYSERVYFSVGGLDTNSTASITAAVTDDATVGTAAVVP